MRRELKRPLKNVKEIELPSLADMLQDGSHGKLQSRKKKTVSFEGDEGLDGSDSDDVEDEAGVEEGQPDLSRRKRKKRHKSETEFFSYDDMEKFADQGEELYNKTYDDDDDDDALASMYEANSGSDDDEGADATFDQFFDQPDLLVSDTQQNQEHATNPDPNEEGAAAEETSNGSDERDEDSDSEGAGAGESEDTSAMPDDKGLDDDKSDGDEDNDDGAGNFDDLDGGVDGQSGANELDGDGLDGELGPMSIFQKQQAKLRKKIEQLEGVNVGERTWELKGEVESSQRPENSLLAASLDYQNAAKPKPVITMVRSHLIKCRICYMTLLPGRKRQKASKR